MELHKEYYYRYSGPSFNSMVKPFFQDFHKLTMEGDYEYPLHFHSNYELIVTDKGPYHCTLNRAELTLNPGEFLIIKPGDYHQDHLYNGQFHYDLHFILMSDISGNQHNFKLFSENVRANQQTGKQDKKSSQLFFRQLEYEVSLADSFSCHIQDALLETYFWQIVRRLSYDVLSEHFVVITQQRNFQQHLYRIFEKYYSKGISVAEMAKHMGMSKRSLSYYCIDYLGVSPAKAMTVYRLTKAAELLRGTTLLIQEISDKLGYDNPFHFSRVFKKFFEKSPKNYRDNLFKCKLNL
jgi:AraC family transcriptional regulator, transcriptional activator of pobA